MLASAKDTRIKTGFGGLKVGIRFRSLLCPVFLCRLPNRAEGSQGEGKQAGKIRAGKAVVQSDGKGGGTCGGNGG